MSNFDTFAPIAGGLPTQAPNVFVGVTPDDLATITASGYMNDLGKGALTTSRGVVKQNDVIFINYSESGSFPTPTSTLNVFYVNVSGGNYSLIAFPALVLGALAASNNLDDVASVSTSRLNLGVSYWTAVTVSHTDLATGGTKVLQASTGSEQYTVRNIILSGAGTNFSGGGGDRLINVQDSSGTNIYTAMTAAKVQSLAATRWGDTGVPFPATAATLGASTVAGESLVAKYSGGTTDYSAGSLTLIMNLQRTA